MSKLEAPSLVSQTPFEIREGNLDPQKLFIGLMGFFSILLPGALLTYLLMREVGPVVLGDRYPKLAGAQAWAAFLFASYLFGYLIFLLGSWLDEFYDWARRYTDNSRITLLARRGRVLPRPDAGIQSSAWDTRTGPYELDDEYAGGLAPQQLRGVLECKDHYRFLVYRRDSIFAKYLAGLADPDLCSATLFDFERMNSTHFNRARPRGVLGSGVPNSPQEPAVIPKSQSRNRLAADVLVLVRSVLGGQWQRQGDEHGHEYQLGFRPHESCDENRQGTVCDELHSGPFRAAIDD